MINFTVGPVQSDKVVLEIGAEQVPYFRTPEFSEIMFENEKLILQYADAPDDSRVVFITGSGTASMEASVINTLSKEDKVLLVNGGSFGERFAEILSLHGIPFEDIKLDFGKTLTQEHLNKYNGNDFSVFIVNIHETSTGVHFDPGLIGDYCKKNNLFLIVDSISSFLADEISMKENKIDVLISGSQKALACPPGISVNVLSPAALDRVEKNETQCMYLDFKSALKNGERGQTPFTPAVGILRQIHARLKQIEAAGGVETEINRTRLLAEDFRSKIRDLPFEIVSESMSNAVTPLHPTTASAYDIFMTLKDEYDIWVCPNGGELKDKVFRVGHIGFLTTDDNDTLIAAFRDMKKRGLI